MITDIPTSSKMKAGTGLILFLWCCLLGLPQIAQAQFLDDLKLYGYFQAMGRYSSLDSNPHPNIDRAMSFSVQQLNLFLFRQFDANYSGFVSLEITNSLSTREGWGDIALEQAWMKYDHNQAFKVKAGLLVPTFNHLNAIKDRTPLLPYILRPPAYETIVEEILGSPELAPERAGIEIYGSLDIGQQSKLDYAVYVGNDDAFVLSEDEDTIPTGSDSQLGKLVGGRAGIRRGGFKVGVSSTFDKADLSKLPLFTDEFDVAHKLDRFRFGADLSISIYPFFFESEFIQVVYQMTAEQENFLLEEAATNFLVRDEIGKKSVYAMLGVNIGEKYYVYGLYAYFADLINPILVDGFGGHSVGAGYRPNDGLVFKIQYQFSSTYSSSIFFGREHDVFVALSVLL